MTEVEWAFDAPRFNGVMFGGHAIGIAVSAAVSGTLIAYHGLPAAVLALAAMTFAILILVLIVRERTGERLLPWTEGAASQRNLDLHLGAIGPIIRNLRAAMFTRQTLLLIPALIAVTAAWGIFWLDSLGGIPAMFIAVAVCSLTATAFAFAAKMAR